MQFEKVTKGNGYTTGLLSRMIEVLSVVLEKAAPIARMFLV
jgi:hypothetical protein